jgi:hypothetical protein
LFVLSPTTTPAPEVVFIGVFIEEVGVLAIPKGLLVSDETILAYAYSMFDADCCDID